MPSTIRTTDTAGHPSLMKRRYHHLVKNRHIEPRFHRVLWSLLLESTWRRSRRRWRIESATYTPPLPWPPPPNRKIEDGIAYHEPVPQRMVHFPFDIFGRWVPAPRHGQTDAVLLRHPDCHTVETKYSHCQTPTQFVIHSHPNGGWRSPRPGYLHRHPNVLVSSLCSGRLVRHHYPVC